MPCKGKCQVQLNDVDIDDVWYKLVPPAKGQPPSPCPASPPDDLAYETQESIKPYFEKISGCEDDKCDCVPVDADPKWSDWQEYDASNHPAIDLTVTKDGKTITCSYYLKGHYYASSAVVDGVCMKRSETAWSRRMRSNRPKWWKKKGEDKKGEEKEPNKKQKK